MDDVPLLDCAVLDELREAMGAASFGELAAAFGEQIEQLAGRLVAALRRDDSRGRERAGHELAGVAGTMGALRLAAAARLAMAEPAPAQGEALPREIEAILAATLVAFADYRAAG